MIARALLLAMMLTAASIASAATRLVAGDEIAVGGYERVPPPPSRVRTAIASDGKTIFAVHGTSDFYYVGLFATRFDLDGRLLTPEPIPIVPRTETEGASGGSMPRVIWFRGHYIVFYSAAADGKLRAVRVTPEGKVVERVSIEFGGDAFDVATDGREFVVNRGTSLLRLDAVLNTIAIVPLTDAPYTANSRGTAYGDGEFMIVSDDRIRVTSRVLRDGVVEPPVQLTTGWLDTYSWSRVVWTGSTFAAAWIECDRPYSRELCATSWATLTSTGQPAGPIHVLGYSDRFSYSWQYDITLTAIDEQTLFFTWPEDTTAMGRRYRIQGAAAGASVEIGRAPAVAFATPSGSLMIVDAIQRMAWIDAAASAPLPPRLDLSPQLLVPPGDTIRGAAASATQVAVLRSHGGALASAVTEVNILTHDGAPVRDMVLDVPSGSYGSIASDGRDFFAVTAAWNTPLLFHDLRTAAKRVITASGGPVGLAWTGSEFLALWSHASGLWVTRLDRDGAALAPPERLSDPAEWTSFTARGGRALLARYVKGVFLIDTLDEHGHRVGPPEEIGGANPYGGIAAASNGDVDFFASIASSFNEARLHVRPRNGVFAPAPNWPKRAGSFGAPAIVPLAGTTQFMTTYRSRNPVLETTNVAIIDAQGFPSSTLSFVTGPGSSPVLLDIAPDTVLMIYQRPVDDSRYAGAIRTFARVLRVEEGAPDAADVVRGAHRQ